MRASIVVAMSGGVTFLFVRIASARIWASGAWREPPPANVIALGALGVAGILCGLQWLARPGSRWSVACLAWAAAATGTGIALAEVGHDSAALVVVLAVVAGIVALPRTLGAGRASKTEPHLR